MEGKAEQQDIMIDDQIRLVLRYRNGEYFVYLENGEKLNSDEIKYAKRIEKLAEIWAEQRNRNEENAKEK